jgi:TP901 family phage tail tape measure protein
MININALLNIQGVDASRAQGAINSLNGTLDKSNKKVTEFSDRLALKGVSLATYTIASAAIIKLSESVAKATNDAIKFEVELAKIAQTTDQTIAEVNKHAQSIRKMSVAYGLSAPKIAETIKVLAQAGYSFDEAKASADNLAKTTLLASFESIADTTDGLIAINKQFINTMGQSAKVLSVLNTVSKKYAVESSDLVEAARKAGGVFSATGGTLEELLSVFTVVRDTTRESAETIATGLRTIFSRIQRPKSIEFFRDLGIELTDLKGNFIGNFEAIQRIQEGLAKSGIKPGSLGFAQVVEELGGLRQASRVIPLLTQGAKMNKIFADAQNATSDTSKDLAKAQETLAFKLAQTQQSFAKLVGEISDSSSFKLLINTTLSLANAIIKVADSLKELIPLLGVFGAFKIARSLGGIGRARISGVALAKGGRVPQYLADGGGPKGTDTIPAWLTPNEIVMRVAAGNKLGRDKLLAANKNPDAYEVRKKRSASFGDYKEHYAAKGGLVNRIRFSQGGSVDEDLDEVLRKLNERTGKKNFKGVHGRGGYQDIDVDAKSQKEIEELYEESKRVKKILQKRASKSHVDSGGTTEQSVDINKKLAEVKETERLLKLKLENPEGFAEERKNKKETLSSERASTKATVDKARADKQKKREEKEAEVEARERARREKASAGGSSPPPPPDPPKGSTSAPPPEPPDKNSSDAKAKKAAADESKRKAEEAKKAAAEESKRRAEEAKREKQAQEAKIKKEEADRKTKEADDKKRKAEEDKKEKQAQAAKAKEEAAKSTSNKSKASPKSESSSTVDPVAAARDRARARSKQIEKDYEKTVKNEAKAKVQDEEVRRNQYPDRSGNAGLGDVSKRKSRVPTGDYDELGKKQAQYVEKQSTKLGANFGLLVAGGAALLQQYTNQETALGRGASQLLELISIIGITQSALAAFNVQLSARGIMDFFSGKGISGLAGKFASLGSKVSTGAGVVGSTVGGAITKAGPLAANAAKIAGPFIAAAASVFALGKIIDAVSGAEQKKIKFIEQGNTESTRQIALSQVAQQDITAFSTALTVGLSAIPVVGPIFGALAGAALKLAAQLPVLGPAIEGAATAARNWAADFGLVDSTELIQSRAGSQAAEQNRKNVAERTEQSIGRQADRVTKGKASGDDFFKSQDFKALAGAANQQIQQDNKVISESNKQIDLQTNTGVIGNYIDGISDYFGESASDTVDRLSADVEAARGRIKESGSQLVDKSKPFLADNIDKFAKGGGTDITKLINNLPIDDMSKKLILNSGRLQELQQELTDSANLYAAEQAERVRLIGIFQNEQKVIADRIRLQDKLNATFDAMSVASEKVTQSFSLLEQNANLTGAASVSNSASGQLRDLTKVTNQGDLDKALNSVNSASNGGLNQGVAQIREAQRLNSQIKGPNGLVAAGLKGKLSVGDFQQKIQGTTGDERQDLIAGQTENLQAELKKAGVGDAEQRNIIDKFSSMIESSDGNVAQADLQKLLEDNLVGPAQETASKVADAYDKQIAALNNFSAGLDKIAEAEARAASQALETVQSNFDFVNTLKELRTDRKTTGQTFRQQSVLKQQVILGQDAGLAGNSVGITNTARDLQQAIADSNEKIAANPESSKNELLVRDENIKRLNKLNQALDEQISGFTEMRDALLAAATAEKEKAKQLRSELLSKTSQTKEDRQRKIGAKVVADAFISGDPRADVSQLTTKFTDTLPEGEQKEAAIKNIEATKARLEQISKDQTNPNAQKAKDILDQVAAQESQLETDATVKTAGGLSLNNRQKIEAERNKRNVLRERGKKEKRDKFEEKKSDKVLANLNPEAADRKKRIQAIGLEEKNAIPNEQTAAGSKFEADATAAQKKVEEANAGKFLILDDQTNILKDSFASLDAQVTALTAKMAIVNGGGAVAPGGGGGAGGGFFSVKDDLNAPVPKSELTQGKGVSSVIQRPEGTPIDAMSQFNIEFSNSVTRLIEMPKTFDISLASEGINVNFNGAEFIAKLPDIMRSIVFDEVMAQMSKISAKVKDNLVAGK